MVGFQVCRTFTTWCIFFFSKFISTRPFLPLTHFIYMFTYISIVSTHTDFQNLTCEAVNATRQPFPLYFLLLLLYYHYSEIFETLFPL